MKRAFNNDFEMKPTEGEKVRKVSKMSYFFTEEIVNEYVSNISKSLNGKTIMNLDQLLVYLELDPEQLIQEIINSEVCRAISNQYIDAALKKSIAKDSTNIMYDIAFVIDLSNPKDATSIISLIIVQRGECFKFENAYTLKLICAKKEGYFLMGMYLYSILSHPKTIKMTKDLAAENGDIPVLHLGILEISGGYKNISGICLYTKFGFRINSKLSGRGANCFQDDNNVAMIKRFGDAANDDTFDNVSKDEYDVSLEKEKIVKVVNKEESGYKKHVICEYTNKDVQMKLANLYNSLKSIQKEYAVLVVESRWLVNKNNPEFASKMEQTNNEIKAIQEQIALIENADKNATLDQLGLTTGGRMYARTHKKKRRKRRTKKRRKSKSRQAF